MGRLAEAAREYPGSEQIVGDYFFGLARAIELRACKAEPEMTHDFWRASLMFAFEHVEQRVPAEHIAGYLEQQVGQALTAPPFENAASPLYVLSLLSERAPSWLAGRYNAQLNNSLQHEADYFPNQADELLKQAERQSHRHKT